MFGLLPIGRNGALVSPQNWWFLVSYTALRARVLTTSSLRLIVTLGEEAWVSFGNRGPVATMMVLDRIPPIDDDDLAAIDALSRPTIEEKVRELREGPLRKLCQDEQHQNPDHRITVEDASTGTLLADYADCLAGILNGDSDRLRRCFWEIRERRDRWHFQQGSVFHTTAFGGREVVIDFDIERFQIRADDEYRRARLHNSDKRGQQAWKKWGVAVSQMRNLDTTLFTGELFDSNVAVVLPRSPSHVPPIWCYCRSHEFRSAVRRIDQKVNVTNATLVKVPFDLKRWEQIAASELPNGLPQPHSDDPTQWLFKGHPKGSTDPLQVAVARLLGYRWPDQEPDDLDALADKDGIVPISATRGEPPAADRLREVLRTAFGSKWSGSFEHKLLTEAGAKSGTSLDDWLLNSFFEQHCRRFHQRPFIWHVWDGRKDGFACLVNYHKLDRALLENLTYSYLQDWINAQVAEAKASKTGADLRLNAAQELQGKLKLILAGERPYDIFVRWKPLAEQPIGWNPDLNDGVRLNIRPFMTAGVLRFSKKPQLNINWNKDRGTEPKRPRDQFPWFWDGDTFKGDRVNDRHYTNAEKQAARKRSTRRDTLSEQ